MSKSYYEENIQIDEDDVVEFLEPIRRIKRPEHLKDPKMPAGHRIHDTIQQLGAATIKRVCQESGLSFDRVVEHIKHHMRMKKPKFRIKLRTR
jgi:hypothetical protein